MQILLRHDDADAFLFHGHDRLDHLLDDLRRQSLRRLVQQHQRRIAHQGARNRQHLLFAATHAASRTIAHFAEIGKQFEQLVPCPLRRIGAWRLAADLEILFHGKVREDAALLGDITEPAAHDGMGRLGGDVPALEHDLPFALLHEPDDGAKGGRFSGTVAAEQRNHLAVPDLKRHIEQDMRGPVKAVEPLNRELHAGAPSRWRAS